jgi:AraC-like DNA-binding protein
MARIVDHQPETLFAFDSRDYQEFPKRFRGDREQEYYAGSCWAEFAQNMNAQAQRKRVGAASIIRLNSLCKIYFRRTWQDIRDDGTDLAILWFVRQGGLKFSNQHGMVVVCPGDFLLTRSTQPFFIECGPHDEQQGEVLHVTVPTHVLRQLLEADFSTPSIHLQKGAAELVIAENIFDDLFHNESGLAEESAHVLVETAFRLIGNAVCKKGDDRTVRRSIADARLDDILRFIEIHLADPRLSVPMVSKGCAISPRYIAFLLRMRGTTYSQTVWKLRLEKARDWLVASDSHEISITEISYGVGFKSPAHFSRMFKKVFGANPRDYREAWRREAETLDFS